MTVHGHPVNSSKAIRAVIEDMRKTLATPGFVLDMRAFASVESDGCHACAGGSAVIWGMDGARQSFRWTDEQDAVANYYDELRIGSWWGLEGNPINEQGQAAWSERMKKVGDDPEAFFAAWEAFADGVEAGEGIE